MPARWYVVGMRKHQFTKKDIGASVVFKDLNGDSYSATVVEVASDFLRVRYLSLAPIGCFKPVCPVRHAVVPRAEWASRLTLFPADSKFFVIS